MDHHDNTKALPEELKRAQDMWVRFTEISKISVIASVAVLAFMALALV